MLSSRHSESAAAARPCWRGAWRAARGGPSAWPAGRRGRGSAGAAPAGPCCRPRPAAWAAWPSAGGCARPRSPCGCPAAPARGTTPRARGRRPRSPRPEEAPPRRPRAPGGSRRAPPARYVRGSAGRREAGDGPGALSRHSAGVLGSYGQAGRSVAVKFGEPQPGTVSGQIRIHSNSLPSTSVVGRCVSLHVALVKTAVARLVINRSLSFRSEFSVCRVSSEASEERPVCSLVQMWFVILWPLVIVYNNTEDSYLA